VVLVDTSVWVDHLRRRDSELEALLSEGSVSVHPFVLGELACGNIRNRTEILGLLDELPSAPVIGVDEFRLLVENHRLWGKGVGYVDVHLLASAAVSSDVLLTRDRRLLLVARELKLALR